MTAEVTRAQPWSEAWDHETPMSWEEYEALDGDVPGEYLDGKLVVSPRPTLVHQRAVRRLANLLDGVLPEAEVIAEGAWKPRADEFAPDVMVIPRTDEVLRFTGTPLLVVEVLSSNRTHDLVRKAAKYARAGLPRYWVLDPVEHVLHDFELQEGVFERVAAVRGRGRTAFLPDLDVDVEALLRA
ncbi:hypothetical protein NUM3379_09950 [Kineococcus sp. NUM-3379]